LAELLRSNDQQKEELKGFRSDFADLRKDLNRNYDQIDENFKLIGNQFKLMNEKMDKVIALDEKVKEID